MKYSIDRYITKLRKTKDLVYQYILGFSQENCKVLINPAPVAEIKGIKFNRGRCNYDLCTNKKIKADLSIFIVYSDVNRQKSSTEEMFFHKTCLENIMKDKRLENVN